MTDTAKLRELAMAATPGPWHVELATGEDRAKFADGTRVAYVLDKPHSILAYELGEPEARYIAAVSPSTVLALLDEIDRLNARQRGLLSTIVRVTNKFVADIGTLQSQLATMTAARDEACEWTESHLTGLEKALGGGDAGTRHERKRIAELRAVGAKP